MSTPADAPARNRMKDGLRAPLIALRRSAGDPVMVRVQMSWAAVMTASWAATVALTVVAYQAGGSRAVALAVVARSIPGAIAGPAVGGLVDRLPRRRTMLWAAATGALATAAAALSGSSVIATTAAITVVALATMVFRAAQSAVMPELVDSPTDLTAANVLSSAIEALGVFVGPALAGILLAVQGPATAFAVSAVLCAVAAGLLVGPPGARPASAAGETGSDGGWGELLRLAPARLILLLMLAQTVLSGGLAVLYAGIAVQDLASNAGAVGVMTSAFGLGGVLGSLGLFALAGSSRLGIWTAIGLMLWTLPLALVPAFGVLPPVLVLLWVVGVGNVLFDVTTVTLLQRAVPEHLLGRAFGAVETVVVVGLGAGALLAPLLESALRPSTALALLAALLAVVAGAALAPLRRLDTSLVAPVRQVALLRELPPFALLPTPALERVALRLQRLEVESGHDVVRQGERGDHWYLVDEGELAVSVDGREVATMTSGQAFGEIALLRAGVRTATVSARGAAVLWALSGEDFLSALSADGGKGLAVADAVADAHLQRAAPRDMALAAAAPDHVEPDGWVAPS